jgi:hypothetical protein
VAGATARVDTFRDLTQGAQKKSWGKSEKDRGVNRREAECAEQGEERSQEWLCHDDAAALRGRRGILGRLGLRLAGRPTLCLVRLSFG